MWTRPVRAAPSVAVTSNRRALTSARKPVPPGRRSRPAAASCARLRRVGPADDHGVTEGEEAVTLGQGGGVERPPRRSAERLHQQEQRRPGQVEVGHQEVHQPERIVPVDVEVGAAGQPPGGRRRLEGADRGGAHGHHPRGFPAGGHRLRRDGVALGVDAVLGGCGGGDGPEGVEPDDQVQSGEAGAGGLAFGEQVGGEVQARGGRGHRTVAGRPRLGE